MKLSGVMLNSENPKKMGDFYTKVFGKTVWQQDDWYGYDVDGGFLMVGPHSDIKGQSKEPARVMVSLVTDDVKAEFDRIKDCGATVVAAPYQPDKDNSPKMWLATVADPDGNYLQISMPWDA